MATSSKVVLPDGTEADASDVMCEGCNESISNHRCTTGTTAGGAPVVVSRSTGPRKVASTRPQCPHCQGAIHFSMPGGLQNTECIMRQYFIDKGIVASPYDRLPLYGIDQLEDAITWAKSLKTPISYGRMESAAGGAGTYAAQRPKAEPRAKKQKAAAAGERIEDLAATTEAAPKKAKKVTDRADRAEPNAPPVLEATVAPVNGAAEQAAQEKASAAADRAARREKLLSSLA